MSALAPVDAFDLPEWLGVAEVTWAAHTGLRTGYAVPGELTSDGHEPLACDLFAVDEAHPAPVAADAVRQRTHQVWRHGEVLLVRRDDRLALAVPGTSFTADLVLDAFARLARAVGASADRYTVLLRIGDSGR
ncbi:hypothetical protein [Nocardioides sp. URHA0020]|uniref:hypothetical protein n=1 Tax=Nocardioides sp. URHA0020 TaxID=1380392 RepID=UPI00048C0E6E|nr:hypothetical protein [Nocardioides sp. URHA0020]